jgi:hypothetical protein
MDTQKNSPKKYDLIKYLCFNIEDALEILFTEYYDNTQYLNDIEDILELLDIVNHGRFSSLKPMVLTNDFMTARTIDYENTDHFTIQIIFDYKELRKHVIGDVDFSRIRENISRDLVCKYKDGNLIFTAVYLKRSRMLYHNNIHG